MHAILEMINHKAFFAFLALFVMSYIYFPFCYQQLFGITFDPLKYRTQCAVKCLPLGTE